MRTKGTANAKVDRSVPISALETFVGSAPQALSGTELAKALIEHVAHVGASGYSNEF